MTVTGVARSLPSRSLHEDRGGAGRVRSVAGWALLGLVLVAWAFTLRPADLGGPATFIVVSGDSMEPVLQDGDLVVLREQDEYAVGDIVTFPVPEGDIGAGTLVIHRIVAVEGEQLVPRGDNRGRVDEWRPRSDDVRGSLWLHVPGGGHLLATAMQPPLLAAVAGGMTTMWVLIREPTTRPRSQSKDEDA